MTRFPSESRTHLFRVHWEAPFDFCRIPKTNRPLSNERKKMLVSQMVTYTSSPDARILWTQDKERFRNYQMRRQLHLSSCQSSMLWDRLCKFSVLAKPSRTRTTTRFPSICLQVSDPAVTYDHRLRNTGHPVRSAIHKPQIGRLVVGWVTTSESLLLYVFAFFDSHSFGELRQCTVMERKERIRFWRWQVVSLFGEVLDQLASFESIMEATVKRGIMILPISFLIVQENIIFISISYNH